MSRRSYGQYCGLAKALDHIGDRWTLLIVRELLLGPRRYSELRASLPGIATNLLAQRLRDLETDGIVVRRGPTQPLYELTEFGQGLEAVVHELVRWGGRWMAERAADETFHPEWLAVALTALVPRRTRGTVEVRSEGVVITVSRGRATVGIPAQPDATVEGIPQAVLGVAAGKLPLSAVEVRGDRAVAAAVLGAADVSRSTPSSQAT
jgi:DNA-binding HxlR family transcriptional regulator